MSTQILDSFKEIDAKSLVDKVEDQLINFLANEGLKIGDSIPKELQLAEHMGVSRTVIREALTRLKTRGILESIKHKGTIIKTPNVMQVLEKSMQPNLLNDAILKDLFEIRLALEVGMANIIAQRVSNRDIAELEKIVANEAKKTEDSFFSINQEVEFHSKLYAISKNQTLMDFQSMLLPIFNYAYDSGLINIPIKKMKYVSHKDLVEVLKQRKPNKFRDAMHKHLYNHYKRLKQLP